MRKVSITSQDGGDSASIGSGLDNDMRKPGTGIIRTKRNSLKKKIQSLSHESDDGIIEPLLQKDKVNTDVANQSAKYLLSKGKTDATVKSEDKGKLLSENQHKPSLTNVPGITGNVNVTLANGMNDNHVTKPLTNVYASAGNYVNPVTVNDSTKGITAVRKNDVLVSIEENKVLEHGPSPLVFTTAKIHNDKTDPESGQTSTILKSSNTVSENARKSDFSEKLIVITKLMKDDNNLDSVYKKRGHNVSDSIAGDNDKPIVNNIKTSKGLTNEIPSQSTTAPENKLFVIKESKSQEDRNLDVTTGKDPDKKDTVDSKLIINKHDTTSKTPNTLNQPTSTGNTSKSFSGKYMLKKSKATIDEDIESVTVSQLPQNNDNQPYKIPNTNSIAKTTAQPVSTKVGKESTPQVMKDKSGISAASDVKPSEKMETSLPNTKTTVVSTIPKSYSATPSASIPMSQSSTKGANTSSPSNASDIIKAQNLNAQKKSMTLPVNSTSKTTATSQTTSTVQKKSSVSTIKSNTTATSSIKAPATVANASKSITTSKTVSSVTTSANIVVSKSAPTTLANTSVSKGLTTSSSANVSKSSKSPVVSSKSNSIAVKLVSSVPVSSVTTTGSITSTKQPVSVTSSSLSAMIAGTVSSVSTSTANVSTKTSTVVSKSSVKESASASKSDSTDLSKNDKKPAVT